MKTLSGFGIGIVVLALLMCFQSVLAPAAHGQSEQKKSTATTATPEDKNRDDYALVKKELDQLKAKLSSRERTNDLRRNREQWRETQAQADRLKVQYMEQIEALRAKMDQEVKDLLGRAEDQRRAFMALAGDAQKECRNGEVLDLKELVCVNPPPAPPPAPPATAKAQKN